MRKLKIPFLAAFVSGLFCLPFFCWLSFYTQGRRFALRDKLKRADAIIVLAGTRGNIKFLHGKINTAVRLYHQG